MRVTEAAVDRIRRNAEAAIHDEQVTRARVDQLEAAVRALGEIVARGFWGRLRWLAIGK